MKPITTYTDYRKVIQDFYDEKKRSSAFTWRDFAKSAGFSSPVFLKYVCEGKKNISRASAAAVAAAMGLVGFDSAYFQAMIAYGTAKSDEAKKNAFEEMCAMAREHKTRILGDNEFDYYKSWKNSVIRELAPAMPGAKPSEMAKACKQLISTDDVVETLAFLQKMGLLEKDYNDTYRQTDKAISINTTDALPVAARNLQRQMGSFALDAISLPLSERDMSGITMGITRKCYDRIVKALDDFRQQIADIVSEDGETEQIYRLNLQFFPLTERIRGGK
ncbi:MAG: TIGR02147 family protein [Fibrobacter sp.]|uniref:TIGR02147 family protein n=1 Tax=Fibrobacter sp. TaxID=35828 RepID=UPI001B08B36B|nr:TIGR02147 family protein [Fibrobacter sp.]MBO7059634.1 TIGR02147 family protein [Fibrobacter sp.]